MDEQDLEILRSLTARPREFRPADESPESAAEWRGLSERVAGLIERGLIAPLPGFNRRSSQSADAPYLKIVARGLTAAGRRELERHSPPGPEVVNAVRQKIEHELRDRRRILGDAYRREMDLYTQRGALRSGMFMQAIERVVEEEYRARGQLVLETWRTVAASRQLAFTAALADLVRATIADALGPWSTDVADAFLQSRTMPDRPRTDAELEAIRTRVVERLEADVAFSLIVPAAIAASAHTPPAPGHSFTIYGNVGALQTGDASVVANVTMHLGDEDRAEVVRQLQQLEQLLASFGVLAVEQREELVDSVRVALAEGRKPKPNLVTLRGLMTGIAMTVQTAAAAPGAYELARSVALLVGLKLP